MREHVKEYEEAVIVLKENANEISRFNRKTYILRATFAATVIVGLAAILGATKGDALGTALAMVPAASISAGCFLMPMFKQMNAARNIKNGKFFEGKNYHQIVNLANLTIDEKNKRIEAKIK